MKDQTASKGRPHSQELAVALEAVEEASRLCRNVQGSIRGDALSKADRSPVTLADFGSQALICRALSAAFPSDPIIAEEDAGALAKTESRELLEKLVQMVGDVRPEADADRICRWIDLGNAGRYADRFWTLDPIDGTKGFLRGEQYAVALALVVEGQVEVAVLGCPNLSDRSDPSDASDPSDTRGRLFYAVRGEGAFERPLDQGSAPRAIRASAVDDPRAIRFCESVEAAHSSHGDAARIAVQLGIGAAPVRIDSQAKYGLVARGEADAYLRLPRNAAYQEKIWDHAAGLLVITEAGGRVTDIHGAPLDFTAGVTLARNQGVVGTNGRVHEPILEAIRALGIG